MLVRSLGTRIRYQVTANGLVEPTILEEELLPARRAVAVPVRPAAAAADPAAPDDPAQTRDRDGERRADREDQLGVLHPARIDQFGRMRNGSCGSCSRAAVPTRPYTSAP